MRPALLNPLFAPVSALPGVGPKTGKLFDRLLDRGAGARVLDLIFHLPHSTLDRRNRPKLRDAPRDQIVTIEVTVVEHRAPSGKYAKTPYKVLVEDETGPPPAEQTIFGCNGDNINDILTGHWPWWHLTCEGLRRLQPGTDLKPVRRG